MRRSRLTRLLTLVFAALQLAVPTLASVADARLERNERGPRAAAHIESHGSPTCARVHPADCALCQFITTLAVAGRGPAPLPACDAVVAVGVEAPPGIRAGRPHALALPRAPPAS